MKKKTDLDDYYDFFQELPQPDITADYLNDIEIQYEYESPGPATGLTDEQVSQLAHDSLESKNKPKTDSPSPSES